MSGSGASDSGGIGGVGDSGGIGDVGDSGGRGGSPCFFQNACNVIAHVIKYRREYEKAIKSIQKAREAREIGGLYCLNFCDPCTGKNITMKGDRILFIVNNPYCRRFCSPTEEALAKVLIYRNFFREVYYSITLAYRARTSVKEFCKTFVVPESLFTITGTRSATLTGKQLLYPPCLGNGLLIAPPGSITPPESGGGNFNPDGGMSNP
jgi:hypothetical protein